MINCKSIISDVEFSYQAEKSNRDFNLSVLRENLLKIPEYKKISEELSETIFEWNKAEFLSDLKNAEKLKEKANELKKRKADLELANGGQKFNFNCSLCKDVGETEDGKCQCYYDKITVACYKELGINLPILNSFSNDTLSKKSGTDKYFDKFKKYADNFSYNSKNVIFTGKTGTGKTFLSQAVAQKISQSKQIVLFLSASALNNVYVENIYQSPAITKNINDVLETCDFLVIDDLGAERILNKITVENLYVLISRRLELNKPFLITTNLSMGELNSRYGDRLFSRLTTKNTVIVNFDGVDLRKKI